MLHVGIVGAYAQAGAVALKSAIMAACGDVRVTIDTPDLREPASDATTILRDRKIDVLDAALRLEREGADVILASCTKAQAFLDEVDAETDVPVLSMWPWVCDVLREQGVTRVGFLGVGEEEGVRAAFKDFDVRFAALEPDAAGAARRLTQEGAQALLPYCAAALKSLAALREEGFPVVDLYAVAAQRINTCAKGARVRPFKIGLIGGLGPAATVDLYDKIVKATPAKTDQEHIKLVVEQNPQIADRTASLLSGGADPTLAMYRCAQRLQADGCHALAVPCNTAHAFVPYLERHLSIPFINMQSVTLEEIVQKFGAGVRVGLLATSGTIATGLYAQKAQAAGVELFVPDEAHQARVMAAIYGPQGAKAGYTDGVCREDLLAAAEYLVKTYDCRCLILGCTELPLILDECDDFELAGRRVALVDATAALARRIAACAAAHNAAHGF